MTTIIPSFSQAELELFCSLPGCSELTPASVMQHSPDAVVITMCQDQLVGRASLWWRQVPDYPSERLGFIGHYAVQDNAAAEALLAECCRGLSAQSCTLAVGPIDGSTWRRYRLLSERGQEPPFFLEPDNPDTWPGHFEAANFYAFAQYYSSINEDNSRGKDRSALTQRVQRAGYKLRSLASEDLEMELKRLWRLSCAAFRNNFLYGPITEGEFRALYAPLIARIRPGLVLLIERQDAPVAFCLAVPDLLQAQRGQAVDTVIIKSLAVLEAHRGKGLGAVLLTHINATARALGMHRTIHALMHADNPSRLLDRPMMRDFRRYTLYARRL